MMNYLKGLFNPQNVDEEIRLIVIIYGLAPIILLGAMFMAGMIQK